VILFREATLAAAIDDEDMWIYDITFGTNRQGYKLGLLTGVTRERRGYVMGMTFMDAETVENFTWVLTRLVSFVGCKPGVLLTDGCTKLYAAIVIVFGLNFAMTCHLLCVWHLSNNVWEHIRPLFGAIVRGSKSGGSQSTLQWRAFNRECALWPTRPDLLVKYSHIPLCPPNSGKFWRIAKKSDWQNRDEHFALEFMELRQMVVDVRTLANAKAIDHELVWLGRPDVPDDQQPDSLWARRQKWAAPWVFTSSPSAQSPLALARA
jgi:hypothetical protein